MGAESFFIILIESETQKKKNNVGEYQFLGSTRIPINNFPLIIDFDSKLLEVSIYEDCHFFQAITFEGCFSCYEKCLKELELIFSRYLSKFNSLMIFDTVENKKIGFSNFDEIKLYILKKYESKFKRYNEIFHGFRKDCLPNKQFYRYYQMRKYDNFIKILKKVFYKN